MMKSYAYVISAVDVGYQKYAIQEAQKLLQQKRNRDAYRWIEEAQQLYREIPFVFRSDRRTVHGILDVLFQRPDGRWGIIDYKTSYVPNHVPNSKNGHLDILRDHARHFHL